MPTSALAISHPPLCVRRNALGRAAVRRPHVRQKARRILHALLLLSAAAAVGGCNVSSRNDDLTVSSIPTDYRLRHPIVVREADRKMEVFIGGRRGTLTPSQRTEVVAFADIWRREATAGIIIEVPAGSPNARAANESVRDIRAVLASVGVPQAAVATRSYRQGDPSELATVRLIYPRMVARAGPCGQWPEDLGTSSGIEHTLNNPYFNLGCAYQRNMAAMVDNPADLVQPRGEGPGLASRRSGALEKYRKGEPTATNYPDAKATISDVGK
jgi:pilus assembly protein CpaD